MTRIPVDPSLSTQLGQANEPVVLCDPSGKVLGRFVPEPSEAIIQPQDDCPDSEDDVRQALAEALAHPEQGQPLTEFWKLLGRGK